MIIFHSGTRLPSLPPFNGPSLPPFLPSFLRASIGGVFHSAPTRESIQISIIEVHGRVSTEVHGVHLGIHPGVPSGGTLESPLGAAFGCTSESIRGTIRRSIWAGFYGPFPEVHLESIRGSLRFFVLPPSLPRAVNLRVH